MTTHNTDYSTNGAFCASNVPYALVPHEYLDSHLSASEKVVLAALFGFRNHKTGLAYPSDLELAHATGMSVTTIRRVLKAIDLVINPEPHKGKRTTCKLEGVDSAQAARIPKWFIALNIPSAEKSIGFQLYRYRNRKTGTTFVGVTKLAGRERIKVRAARSRLEGLERRFGDGFRERRAWRSSVFSLPFDKPDGIVEITKPKPPSKNLDTYNEKRHRPHSNLAVEPHSNLAVDLTQPLPLPHSNLAEITDHITEETTKESNRSAQVRGSEFSFDSPEREGWVPSFDDENETFRRFTKVYPRTDAQSEMDAAAKEWRRLWRTLTPDNRKSDMENLFHHIALSKADQWHDDRAGGLKDPKWIPKPANYLKSCGWRDSNWTRIKPVNPYYQEKPEPSEEDKQYNIATLAWLCCLPNGFASYEANKDDAPKREDPSTWFRTSQERQWRDERSDQFASQEAEKTADRERLKVHQAEEIRRYNERIYGATGRAEPQPPPSREPSDEVPSPKNCDSVWFADLPEDIQNEMLGREKADQFRAADPAIRAYVDENGHELAREFYKRKLRESRMAGTAVSEQL